MKTTLTLAFAIISIISFSQWTKHNVTRIDRGYNFCTGDFDNDGDIDFISTTDPAMFILLENIGQGKINEGEILLNLIPDFPVGVGATMDQLEAADIDLDGNLDLIFTYFDSLNNYKTVWSKNIGNFQFSNPNLIFSSTWGLDNHIFHLEDINSDNYIDILIYKDSFPQTGGGAFLAYSGVNQQNGSFNLNLIYSNPLTNYGVIPTHIDIEMDGDIDIIFRDILLQNQGGSFSVQNLQFIYPPYSTNTSSFGLRNEIVGDFNGDGTDDLISYQEHPSYLDSIELIYTPFMQNGTVLLVLNDTSIFQKYNYLKSVDFNSDGNMDILACFHGNSEMKVALLINDGNANFTEIEIHNVYYDNYTNFSKVEYVDFDNDGLKDIVMSSWNELSSCFFKNLGGLNFSEAISFSNNEPLPASIAIGDINNDSKEDIVSANYENLTMSYYENTNSVFGNSIVHLTGLQNQWYSYEVDLIDADNDNDRDMVFIGGGSNPGYAIYFRYFDNGRFDSLKVLKDSIHWAYKLKVIDYDLDGMEDIIVAFQAADYMFTEIVLFQNAGGGNFNEVQLFGFSHPQPFNINSFEVVDIDNDGDNDISYADSRFLEPKWLEQISLQNYISHDVYFTYPGNPGFSPYYVSSLDADNDGLYDLVYCYYSTWPNLWHVYLYKNLGSGIFNQEQFISYSNGEGGVSSGDYNNDGFDDILFKTTQTELMWFIGDATMSYSATDLITNEGASKFYLCDINGDNYTDVAIIKDWVSQDIAWYEGNTNTTLGAEESIIETNTRWNIYPNPAKDIAYLKDIPANGILNIHSIDGKIILNQKFNNTGYLTINLSDFESGCYIVSIRNKSSFSSKKLIVE